MAPRMKWMLAVVGLAGALALAFSRGGISTSRVEEFAAQSRLWRVSNELGATRRAIVQWETLESLRGVIPDSGVAFAGSAADSSGVFAEVRDSIVAEVAAMGGSRSRIAVLVTRPSRSADSYLTALPVQYFAGHDSMGGWCAVAIDPTAGHTVALRDAFFAGGSALGPCWFWARYGTPGPAIAESLPGFGLFMGATRPWRAEDAPPHRRLFGVRQWTAPVAPHVTAQACAAGRIDACERALDPSSWSASLFGHVTRGADDPAMLIRARWQRGVEPPATLAADLQSSAGPASFAEFWRSTGELRGALERATGTPARQWMHDWTVSRFGVQPRGPRVSVATLLLTLLTIGALGAASLILASRRRVA